MLQRHGMILKGREEIGLRGVSGVSRLREQTQIGQLEPCDQLFLHAVYIGVSGLAVTGMEEKQGSKNDAASKQEPHAPL